MKSKNKYKKLVNITKNKQTQRYKLVVTSGREQYKGWGVGDVNSWVQDRLKDGSYYMRKIVFYNTIDKTVYKEIPFENLAPGNEFSYTIENPDDMLSATYEHFAVRIMGADESVNSNQPTYKFRHLELLPAWFKGYINKVGGRSADGINNDPSAAVPNTGNFTTKAVIVATASGGVAAAALGASMGALWLARKRRK